MDIYCIISLLYDILDKMKTISLSETISSNICALLNIPLSNKLTLSVNTIKAVIVGNLVLNWHLTIDMIYDNTLKNTS